jgi:hypothetical protein
MDECIVIMISNRLGAVHSGAKFASVKFIRISREDHAELASLSMSSMALALHEAKLMLRTCGPTTCGFVALCVLIQYANVMTACSVDACPPLLHWSTVTNGRDVFLLPLTP